MSNKIDKISSLGKEILQAIGNQRLTKKHVYDKLGISRGTLDNWISGATAPDHLELGELYKILGIGSQSKIPEPTPISSSDLHTVLLESIRGINKLLDENSKLISDKREEVARLDRDKNWAFVQIDKLHSKLGIPKEAQ